MKWTLPNPMQKKKKNPQYQGHITIWTQPCSHLYLDGMFQNEISVPILILERGRPNRLLKTLWKKGENAGNQHFLLFPQCFLYYEGQLSSMGNIIDDALRTQEHPKSSSCCVQVS